MLVRRALTLAIGSLVLDRRCSDLVGRHAEQCAIDHVHPATWGACPGITKQLQAGGGGACQASRPSTACPWILLVLQRKRMTMALHPCLMSLVWVALYQLVCNVRYAVPAAADRLVVLNGSYLFHAVEAKMAWLRLRQLQHYYFKARHS